MKCFNQEIVMKEYTGFDAVVASVGSQLNKGNEPFFTPLFNKANKASKHTATVILAGLVAFAAMLPQQSYAQDAIAKGAIDGLFGNIITQVAQTGSVSVTDAVIGAGSGAAVGAAMKRDDNPNGAVGGKNGVYAAGAAAGGGIQVIKGMHKDKTGQPMIQFGDNNGGYQQQTSYQQPNQNRQTLSQLDAAFQQQLGQLQYRAGQYESYRQDSILNGRQPVSYGDYMAPSANELRSRLNLAASNGYNVSSYMAQLDQMVPPQQQQRYSR